MSRRHVPPRRGSGATQPYAIGAGRFFDRPVSALMLRTCRWCTGGEQQRPFALMAILDLAAHCDESKTEEVVFSCQGAPKSAPVSGVE